MIVEYLRYSIDAERQADFIRDYRAASKPLQRSDYCEQYEFCQCVEDPSKFIIRIQWTSADDHLQRFRGSAEFKEFFGHIKSYVGDIDEMRHYDVKS
ncbi:MAG: antibiotic biosynthesis monooxygenase [Granulosicoccus sp.]|nr:antibiotic biosynthesis monooxygenase [Granulosicoccus sp.]